MARIRGPTAWCAGISLWTHLKAGRCPVSLQLPDEVSGLAATFLILVQAIIDNRD
ncbi:hypothetical protein GCM10009682_54930 [Luedemannella flava]|uniref:Uncharacterized protein n=1 Tax=Luedemannella flava TaxID=349316 RepID=A0ABP4YV45_9ACTN